MTYPVIIDIKTSWRLFLLFSWQKEGNTNCSYFKVTRIPTQPVLLWTAVIGIHADSVYYNPYTGTQSLI